MRRPGQRGDSSLAVYRHVVSSAYSKLPRIAERETTRVWENLKAGLLRLPEEEAIELVVGMSMIVSHDPSAVERTDEGSHEDVARPVLAEIQARIPGATGD